MVLMSYFSEWPVTFSGARSLVRLTQFVRMQRAGSEHFDAEGRCPR
jgi:hypothetical protein